MLQILVGNKCDMDESKRKVPYSKGQALADEFGIRFFETSAKTNSNVDDVSPDCSCLIEEPPLVVMPLLLRKENHIAEHS